MKHRVLLIEPTIRPIGVNMLKEHCEVFMVPNGKEETLVEAINKNQIEAIITRVEFITGNIIENCPTLKVIGQHGVGLDNIDITVASEHGIMVLNVPDANYVSVAEHSIMFILALSRSLIWADENVRAGHWSFREEHIPMEIAGKKLLIIGVGRIGKEVARKALALDMKVIGYDGYVSAESMQEAGVEKRNNLQDAMAEADFITIHVPLTPETKHMISAEQFKMMKPTACIINLGRGGIIDEDALEQALSSNMIGGAALDVFEKEPVSGDHLLFKQQKLIVTPHQGGDTMEAKQRASSTIARTVIEALNTGDCYNFFNRRIIKK